MQEQDRNAIHSNDEPVVGSLQHSHVDLMSVITNDLVRPSSSQRANVVVSGVCAHCDAPATYGCCSRCADPFENDFSRRGADGDPDAAVSATLQPLTNVVPSNASNCGVSPTFTFYGTYVRTYDKY